MDDSTPLTSEQLVLVENHMGLAQHIAMAFWKRAPNALDRDELVAVAYQGLVTAALRFDLSYRPDNDPGYRPELAFGPWARTKITGTIQDWLRTIDHVPRRQRKTYREMQMLAPGRSPEETAAILGIDPARVRAITHAVECPPVSLDEIQDAATRDPVSSTPIGGTEGEAMTNLVQEAVGVAFTDMDDMSKSVLALKYYSGLTFTQIAAQLGTSTARVKEIHQEAVVTVHSVMLRVVTS